MKHLELDEEAMVLGELLTWRQHLAEWVSLTVLENGSALARERVHPALLRLEKKGHVKNEARAHVRGGVWRAA